MLVGKKMSNDPVKDIMLDYIYEALKLKQDNKLPYNCIGVGVLNAELSAIYLATESMYAEGKLHRVKV